MDNRMMEGRGDRRTDGRDGWMDGRMNEKCRLRESVLGALRIPYLLVFSFLPSQAPDYCKNRRHFSLSGNQFPRTPGKQPADI